MLLRQIKTKKMLIR